jgi:hypothetical protein
MIIPHWIPLRMRNVSGKDCRQIETFFCSITVSESHVGIMWKDIVEPDRLQVTI